MRANGILNAAARFFAAELDRPHLRSQRSPTSTRTTSEVQRPPTTRQFPIHIELLEYLAHADARRVLPGADTLPEPWLLSSSVAGAELAAEFGLPLAFACHIRPVWDP
ncbi:hypothetical protein [Peterkaempfera sp. SMS 1(5)a]|uniref:hypothetical protein n=1 Tax=Peterkaempfera podocarpi TaxID=3232308 RepID=UPI0036729332